MSSPRVCVLIASHMRYDGQVSYLHECIAALKAQTYPCDILLSVSGALDETLDEVLNVGVFKHSPNRLYQLEHFHLLRHEVQQYDMIMFCDDDDLYELCRVAAFVEAYQLTFPELGTRTLIVERDGEEYWELGVTPFLFEAFWERVQDVALLRCTFGDMYLRNFFRSYVAQHVFVKPTRPLYHYRSHADSTLRSMRSLRTDGDFENASADVLIDQIRLLLAFRDGEEDNITYMNQLLGLSHALMSGIVSTSQARAWIDLRNRLLDTTTSPFLQRLLGSPTYLLDMRCNACHEANPRFHCPCRRVWYCDRQCQRNHWSAHKPNHLQVLHDQAAQDNEDL